MLSTFNTDNIRVKRKNVRGTSKFKGVSVYRRTSKWQAGIKVNGKSINLGHYESEEEAALAYNKAARLHFGEFARLNVL